MSVLVSHPTGNPNVRAVLRALERSGALHSFHTSLAVPRRMAQASFIPSSLRRELARRVFGEVPASKTQSRPYRELVRVVAGRLGLRSLIRHEVGFASVDRVYEDLDRAVARDLESPGNGVRAIYAYEDGALHSFRTARQHNIQTIYELPIAYWRTRERIMREERELRPEWSSTLHGLKDSKAKCARKDEEIHLAERIVVPSTFVKTSLTEHFGDAVAIEVAPYGAPAPSIDRPSIRTPEQALEIFYAGHLSQRKGIAYLFDSVQRIDFPWKLTLAGPKPAERCSALEGILDHSRCRWLGAIPHATLLQEMSRAHVFVLPSLVEGLALVILEAMAAGLPVITTPNSGAVGCIDENENGFIVPVRDAEAIASRLATLYDHEDRRFAMALAAIAKAEKLSWSRFEHQISGLVAKILL